MSQSSLSLGDTPTPYDTMPMQFEVRRASSECDDLSDYGAFISEHDFVFNGHAVTDIVEPAWLTEAGNLLDELALDELAAPQPAQTQAVQYVEPRNVGKTGVAAVSAEVKAPTRPRENLAAIDNLMSKHISLMSTPTSEATTGALPSDEPSGTTLSLNQMRDHQPPAKFKPAAVSPPPSAAALSAVDIAALAPLNMRPLLVTAPSLLLPTTQPIPAAAPPAAAAMWPAPSAADALPSQPAAIHPSPPAPVETVPTTPMAREAPTPAVAEDGTRQSLRAMFPELDGDVIEAVLRASSSPEHAVHRLLELCGTARFSFSPPQAAAQATPFTTTRTQAVAQRASHPNAALAAPVLARAGAPFTIPVTPSTIPARAPLAMHNQRLTGGKASWTDKGHRLTGSVRHAAEVARAKAAKHTARKYGQVL